MNRVLVSISLALMIGTVFSTSDWSTLTNTASSDGSAIQLDKIRGKDGCPHCVIDEEDFWDCISPHPRDNTCEMLGCVPSGNCPSGRKWRGEAIPEHTAGVFDPPQYDERLITSNSVNCHWRITCITGEIQEDKSCYPGTTDPEADPQVIGSCGLLNPLDPGCKTCTEGPMDIWEPDITTKVDPGCIPCNIIIEW